MGDDSGIFWPGHAIRTKTINTTLEFLLFFVSWDTSHSKHTLSSPFAHIAAEYIEDSMKDEATTLWLTEILSQSLIARNYTRIHKGSLKQEIENEE